MTDLDEEQMVRSTPRRWVALVVGVAAGLGVVAAAARFALVDDGPSETTPAAGVRGPVGTTDPATRMADQLRQEYALDEKQATCVKEALTARPELAAELADGVGPGRPADLDFHVPQCVKRSGSGEQLIVNLAAQRGGLEPTTFVCIHERYAELPAEEAARLDQGAASLPAEPDTAMQEIATGVLDRCGVATAGEGPR